MRRLPLSLLFLIAVLVFFAAPWIGIERIPLSALGDPGSLDAKIFWQLRVPRVLLAWCAGATFGICGMVFQALFRNPLAEPSLLGVSSGAALGAATVIRIGLGATVVGAFAIPMGAFLGAVMAIAVVCGLARLTRGTGDAALLLGGVAISSLFSSLIMIFQYTGGAVETYHLLSWTMGGIRVTGMGEGLRALPSLVVALGLGFFFAPELDLITCGDEIARTRGVRLETVRNALFAGTSLSVAIVVANCGPIAFIGLMAPHIARIAIGVSHRRLVLGTTLVGGTILLLCDTLARTVLAPADLPVGILISFLGAPFFLWLLFKRRSV